jgi:hypothetical protein
MVRRDVITIDDIDELPGYVSVAKAADRYGVNKGTIYYHIFTTQELKTVFKITKGGDDPRPLLVISEAEVDKVFTRRNAERVDTPQVKLDLRSWNRRVKQWAAEVHWTKTPVLVSGPPHRILELAYQDAHPEDTKPGS